MKSNKIWQDRKRHLGLPVSFTKYSLSENRFFCETGFFHTREEEILLYRIRDISLSRTLGQKIFGVGSILLNSSDPTAPTFQITNVTRPYEVKETIFSLVEKARNERRVWPMEMVNETGDNDSQNDDFDDFN